MINNNHDVNDLVIGNKQKRNELFILFDFEICRRNHKKDASQSGADTEERTYNLEILFVSNEKRDWFV